MEDLLWVAIWKAHPRHIVPRGGAVVNEAAVLGTSVLVGTDVGRVHVAPLVTAVVGGMRGVHGAGEGARVLDVVRLGAAVVRVYAGVRTIQDRLEQG